VAVVVFVVVDIAATVVIVVALVVVIDFEARVVNVDFVVMLLSWALI